MDSESPSSSSMRERGISLEDCERNIRFLERLSKKKAGNARTDN